MSDDKTIRGPGDASRISLKEDYEIRYWTSRFGCDEQQLRDAVGSVGNSAVAVEQYLKNRR
jgi:hypothetical protein